MKRSDQTGIVQARCWWVASISSNVYVRGWKNSC